MLPSVKINQQDIAIKEHAGQRVVTFRDIDTAHGRKSGTARKRFNDNRRRFILGKDYFVRNSDEAMKELHYPAPNGLMLITESGYLMIVKSFTDDLAWQVQRELVNIYFKHKQLMAPMQLPVLVPTTKQHVDNPDNRDVQALLAKVRAEITALTVALEKYNRYLELDRAKAYQWLLADLGWSIGITVRGLAGLQLGITDKHIV